MKMNGIKGIKGILFVFASLIIASCAEEDNKVLLFNGENLDNWTVEWSDSIPGGEEVFQVSEGILKISGIPRGYILTKESYQNYKLHVEWRWSGEPGNSGVLVHCKGTDQPFPHCVEAQLKHQNAGDLVIMQDGASITIDDSTYVNNPGDRWAKGIKKPGESSENPVGEWNEYDITCDGGNIELIVNGVLQHTGSNANPSSGQIALQSEGAPIEFRNIYLVTIEE